MLIKLALPAFSRDIHGGTIVRWHVGKGDTVGFGDDLFDLLVSERVAMKRPLEADVILSMGSREPTYRPRPTVTYFRVVSADAGVLREIRVEVDQDLAVGEVAALLSTDPGGLEDVDPAAMDGAPEMRVAVNVIEEDN